MTTRSEQKNPSKCARIRFLAVLGHLSSFETYVVSLKAHQSGSQTLKARSKTSAMIRGVIIGL